MRDRNAYSNYFHPVISVRCRVRNKFMEFAPKKDESASPNDTRRASQKIQINNIHSFKWFTVLFTTLAIAQPRRKQSIYASAFAILHTSASTLGVQLVNYNQCNGATTLYDIFNQFHIFVFEFCVGRFVRRRRTRDAFGWLNGRRLI